MPKDEIKIKVESNIFSDADKIKTAHSYNIALPRTMTNDSILGLAYLAGAETGGKTTHKYLDASLYLDGVPLFEKGQAVLTSVDEKGYNINLYWGLLNIFDTIKEEDLNLCDLPMSSLWNENTMANWIELPQYDDQQPQYDGGMSQYIYDNQLDGDSKALADKLPWMMPSIRATAILDKIYQVYGLRTGRTTEASVRIAQLWHPLVTRKLGAKNEHLTFTLNAVKIAGSNQLTWDATPLDMSNQNIFDSLMHIGQSPINPSVYTLVANTTIKNAKIRVVGYCDTEFCISYQVSGYLDGFLTCGDYNSDKQRYEMDTTMKDSLYISEWGQYIPYVFDEGNTMLALSLATTHNNQFDIKAYIDIELEDAEAKVGDKWCYERNYPEIGIIDYYSELLAHIGGCIIGSVTKPKNLLITTIDEICENEPINLDEYGVQSITMSTDDLAQKNIYKHKENNDLDAKNTAEGVIYVADETLKISRTAFDSHFKVIYDGIVKLWKLENSTTQGKQKASWGAEGDYIAGYDGWVNTLMNTGQDFATTIAEYYTNYEQIINHPKEIEVVVRLSVLDLLNFDMARPVYIAQLGRKYLIKSLESDSGEKYKLTLVQI